ncbi:hypothetical protein HYPSUDRAFT_208178 [Hypholoma sublateritium FD-334 SS-4]|uniref:Uncharacterized protein n=1 Tax=Hypholoma sublateritium (strain FD-334 SS-4) TaxID=945553 RepID=A0A0D2P3D5_HYPSF|nr:hypothetical protein HYPSUDRAFT_208178 [Hypholoma sublateritium FD-334 SS-4]
MSNTPASRSPRQSIIDSTRNKLASLLRTEAELRAGPRPAVQNSDGHLYRVALCMGKSQDFYAIGKWYKICINPTHRRKNLNCGRPTFFPSVPLTPVQKTRLEELWVRYAQTGSKWGDSYPPDALTNHLYLSSQFAPAISGAASNRAEIPAADIPPSPPTQVPSTSNAPGRKRDRSSSPSNASSSKAPKRSKYDKLHIISIADVKRAEQKRTDQKAGNIPQPVRPITFIDHEVIEVLDSDEESL